MDNYENDNYENRSRKCKQRHTHEYLGSTQIAELGREPHNHRFAGVTGEAIQSCNSHYHRLETNTDFYEDHFHIVANKTDLAIPVGDGRHIHYVMGQTTRNDGHKHEFRLATLIEDPIAD